MKKIIIPIVLLAFIVPQIALASWWNPISWFNNWTFHSNTDTQTQVLENRIAELESKLNNSATATGQITTSTLAIKATSNSEAKSVSQLVVAKKQVTGIVSNQDKVTTTFAAITPTSAPTTTITLPPTSLPVNTNDSNRWAVSNKANFNWSGYSRINVNYYVKNPLPYFQQPVDVIVGVITGFVPAIDPSRDSSYIEITDGTVLNSADKMMLKITDSSAYSFIVSTQKIGDIESAYGTGQRTQEFKIDGTSNTKNEPVILLERLDNCNPYTCRIGETTMVWSSK